MPSTSIHIVLYFLLVIMIDCAWRIIKRCHHIRFDIRNLGCGVLHAANHIIQVRTVPFQEL